VGKGGRGLISDIMATPFALYRDKKSETRTQCAPRSSPLSPERFVRFTNK